MSDEWRVEVQLEDEGHGLTLGDRLRSLDLDDEARKRLGERVVVTRDGPRLFLYAGNEAGAREAENVARDLAGEEGLEATTRITRWHPDAEDWKDAAVPMPKTEAEREAERLEHEAAEEREAAETGRAEWELRVDLQSLHDTRELAARLSDEGIDVHRRWKHLLIPAPSEERATELADRIRGEAPQGTEIHVELARNLPHPAFVFIARHTPGIGRDLGV
jgi:hypothetical protein